MHRLSGGACLSEVEYHGLQPAGLQVLHDLNNRLHDGLGACAPAGMGSVRRG
ncbi:hypothetical protein D3C80_1217760 [compost metagenome]